jgi:hypothetical protein
MRFLPCRQCLVAVAVFVLCWAESAQARPCGRTTVDSALARAAVVVKGDVVSAEDQGADIAVFVGADRAVTIRIARLLKGRIANSSVTALFFPCSRESAYAFKKGSPVIAFIDAKGEVIEMLPASSRPVSPDSNPTAALRQQFLVALDDSDQFVGRIALGALAELDGRNALPTLNRYRNAKRYDLRFRALTWLARFGDVDAFEELTRLVSEPSFKQNHPNYWTDADEPVLTAHGDFQDLLRKLSLDARNGETMPSRQRRRFVRALMALSQLDTRLFRWDAIYTLREMKDPAAFPVLLDALDDPDKDVRLQATHALCEALYGTANQCPDPAVFGGDEQYYMESLGEWLKARLR